MVFKMIGIPGADHIMNAVVMLAIISSMNSDYMVHPAFYIHKLWTVGFRKSFHSYPKKKVPVYAILMCTSALYVGVMISLFAGSKTFDFLMGSLGYTVLFIWLIIAIRPFEIA